MTTLDPALVGASPQPPRLQQFSNPVRYGLVAIVAALAALSLIFDWPFGTIGVFQPIMLAAGVIAVSYVTDIPFKSAAPKFQFIFYRVRRRLELFCPKR